MRIMLSKALVFAVIVLFLNISVIPDVSSDAPTNGIIYVDDDGGADYTKIQDAIDNATDGDTVYVYNGSYYENVVVDKTINLKGEKRDSTIIDGNGISDVVYISADNVTIKNFTIKNSGNSGRDAGIEIQANHANISNNIIYDNTNGLYLYYSNNNSILRNIFISNSDYGLFLHFSDCNHISSNYLTKNRWGIYCIYSDLNSILNNNIYLNKYHGIWISRISNNNTIYQNIIDFNDGFGLYFYNSDWNNISGNEISNNSIGIYFFWSNNNKILKNDFLLNKKKVSFVESDNYWRRNYWNRYMLLPKLIIEEPFLRIPNIDCDWHPARTPYGNINHFIIDIKPNDYSLENKQKNQYIFLPSYFSWQDINGTDFTTPVKNQAPAPTCEAYALCASLESIIQYEIGYPFGCDLSETHLYFYSGGTCKAGGVLLGDAAEYLVKHGVPDEGCFPDPHRSYDYPFESIQGWENRTVKIREWGWVENNVEAIKQALIQHGPLIIHIIVRPGFYIYSSGIYTPWRGEIKGGHLITIVGYDDTEQCWICKNSGGSNWGENGYIKVSYYVIKSGGPFFWPFYGGTGILYIDGIYGNLMPDVPEINIENPKRHHTYVFGMEFPTIYKDLKFVEKAVPRIIGWTNIKVNATNANVIKFFFDGKLQYVDEDQPYEWKFDNMSKGSHTIEAFAFNDVYVSKSICDIFNI